MSEEASHKPVTVLQCSGVLRLSDFILTFNKYVFGEDFVPLEMSISEQCKS